MKEIVVISGKGGTGKTSVCASLAVLAHQEAIIADCDVDAADMHLLMQPEVQHQEIFYSGLQAIINPEVCTNCGLCEIKCRFDAIHYTDNKYQVNPIDCEGCGLCEKICPAHAIKMMDQESGTVFHSNIRTETTMVHAKLTIAAENSGKLVAKVKKDARQIAEKQEKAYIIIDGSPGIGCPVVSSLSGAKYALIITEPSKSGLHDMERVIEVAQKFRIPIGVIINKSDLNEAVKQSMYRILKEEKIEILAELPFSSAFTQAMLKGKTIVEENDSILKERLISTWETIKKHLNQ